MFPLLTQTYTIFDLLADIGGLAIALYFIGLIIMHLLFLDQVTDHIAGRIFKQKTELGDHFHKSALS